MDPQVTTGEGYAVATLDSLGDGYVGRDGRSAEPDGARVRTE